VGLGGQLLLTEGAADLARRGLVGTEDSQDLTWCDHGFYTFKGIDEPIRVFEVGAPGHAPLRPPPASEKARPYVAAPDASHSTRQTLFIALATGTFVMAGVAMWASMQPDETVTHSDVQVQSPTVDPDGAAADTKAKAQPVTAPAEPSPGAETLAPTVVPDASSVAPAAPPPRDESRLSGAAASSGTEGMSGSTEDPSGSTEDASDSVRTEKSPATPKPTKISTIPEAPAPPQPTIHLIPEE